MTTFLETLDRGFAELGDRSRRLIAATAPAELFRKPRDLGRTFAMFSVGEYIVRSAGAVEQTFGGLTTKLWDDPFEWTLPEELSSPQRVMDYLAEVEATRERGFAFLKLDAELGRHIAAPGGMRTIFSLLIDTLGRAQHYQGRAFAIFQLFSDVKLPRI